MGSLPSLMISISLVCVTLFRGPKVSYLPIWRLLDVVLAQVAALEPQAFEIHQRISFELVIPDVSMEVFQAS